MKQIMGSTVIQFHPHVLPNANINKDVDPQAIPPRWPPMSESLAVNNCTYELRRVPMTSIIYVTSKTVKVGCPFGN